MSAETVGGAAVMSESARNYRRQTERVASAGEQRLAAGGAAEAANEYGRRLIFLLFILGRFGLRHFLAFFAHIVPNAVVKNRTINFQ